ncbi:MAG: hypothetical protein KBC46_00275 [Ferrovibrio sp.]|nr:hypothetical protein [Ferrovibrio sp.]
MRFQYLLAALVVLAACGAGLLFGNLQAAEKPSRTECIAGYKLDWSTVTKDRQYEIGNSLVPLRRDGPLKNLVAMIFSNGRERLYFQYASDCSQKWQISEELLLYWQNREHDFPPFERIAEPILPSPTTIDVKGLSWRD